VSYVIAAYTVVLVTLAGYALGLQQRRQRLRDELARGGHPSPEPRATPPELCG